jgi:molybdopterin biosynthesis enzyme MoaB
LSGVFEERFRYYRLCRDEKEALLKRIKEFLSRYDVDLAIVLGASLKEKSLEISI